MTVVLGHEHDLVQQDSYFQYGVDMHHLSMLLAGLAPSKCPDAWKYWVVNQTPDKCKQT
jgi:hypothetical protein